MVQVARVLSLTLLTVFFTSAAYVNLNDPDPEIWVAMYAACALLCLYTTFKDASPKTLIILSSLTLSWIFHIGVWSPVIQDFIAGNIDASHFLHYEEGRELSGLLCILITLLWILFIQVAETKIVIWPALFLIIVGTISACVSIFYASFLFHDFNEDQHCGGGNILEDSQN